MTEVLQLWKFWKSCTERSVNTKLSWQLSKSTSCGPTHQECNFTFWETALFLLFRKVNDSWRCFTIWSINQHKIDLPASVKITHRCFGPDRLFWESEEASADSTSSSSLGTHKHLNQPWKWVKYQVCLSVRLGITGLGFLNRNSTYWVNNKNKQLL